jgi:hypothetical protein
VGFAGADPPEVTAVPPGWYPDPRDGARVRWFDGSHWTDHVRRDPFLLGGATILPNQTKRRLTRH